MRVVNLGIRPKRAWQTPGAGIEALARHRRLLVRANA